MMANSGHVMTLANSIIGVGILAMPFCFQKCGIVLSIVLLILNNFITRVSCHYLIKSSLLTRRKSFEFLGFHAFGSSGKLLVELCIIGYLIGSCITYFVVVGDVGPQIVAKIFGLNGTDGLRTWVMVVVTIICILPLGMLKNVDSLSAVCTASIGFYLCLVVKIILESQTHILANDWQQNIVYWDPSGVLQCLPIFSMALSCQMQLFEVLESVNNQSLEKLNAIIKNATWMCTVVYIAVGFFGYIAFCTQIFSGNILINFTPTFGSDAIKIGFVLSVAFSFPLVIFPCRASIYSLLYRRGHAETTGYIPETRFKLITVFIVVGSLCIALMIPSIELVIGLVGSTIGIVICIIFPAACFRKISKKDSTERTLAQALIVGGCCLMILGTYANLSAIDEKRSGPTSILQETATKPATPLPIYEKNIEKPKELVKDVRLQNLTLQPQKLPAVENKQQPAEKPPVLPEKVEAKPKTSPPLPVDEVERVDVKPPKENPPEKLVPVVVSEAVPPVSEMPSNSNVIAKDAIKKDEEIAAEERQKDTDKQEQLAKAQNELKKTKELLERKVDELKEELAKQNKETQELVVEKLGEVVEKVEQIEREVHKESQKEQPAAKPAVAGPIAVPKGSILGILTENKANNMVSEEAKQVSHETVPKKEEEQSKPDVYEPLSYKTGELIKKTQDAVVDIAKDARAPLPLPLLINATQNQVAKDQPPAKLEPSSKESKTVDSEPRKALETKIAAALESKLPVDEAEPHVVPPVNVSEEKVVKEKPVEDQKKPAETKEDIEVKEEKENIEAIRRDILEVNKDQADQTYTTMTSSREKREVPALDFAKIDSKLQEENCLNDVKVDSLMVHNGIETKLQGLGRDLKSVTDEE